MSLVSHHRRREFELSNRSCLIMWLAAFALQSSVFVNVVAGMFDWTWVIGWAYHHAAELYVLLALLHFLVCLFAPFKLWIRFIVCLGWLLSIGVHYLLLIASAAILHADELRQH